MIYFLLVSQILALDTTSCQALSCTPGPTRTICIEQLTGYIQISPCVSGLQCNTTSLSTQLTSWPTVTCTQSPGIPNLCEDVYRSLFTGQSCCVDSNCISNQCTNDHCVGLDPGANCTQDEECQPNYFCNNTCMTATFASCYKDNQCASGWGCMFGICYQFHTLANGAVSDRVIFCKSNFTFGGFCDVIKAYSNGVDLGEFLQCNIGNTCLYYTGNNHTLYDQGMCMCAGVGNSLVGYCGAHADKNAIVLNFYEALVYNTSDCSGILASSDDPDQLYTCGSIPMKNYNYSKVMINRYKYYNLYKSSQIDHCARPLGIFNPWYDNTTFISFSILFSIPIILALIN